MKPAGPMLIVPVENQVRELDGKLLLACAAAERGFDVTLGSRTFVHFAMPYLPRGLFLGKSLRSISARMFKLIHKLGHHIVAWDEESLVRFPSDEYYGFRYSRETFAAVDRLFAWGPDDADFFAGYPGYTGAPIHVTGNPRMDLLRPELRGFFDDDVRALRQRFGDFILVNTNFPFVNPFVPELALLQPNPDGTGFHVGRSGRGMSLSFARGYAAHMQTICEHFQTLLPQLARQFPGHTIVVRPHPSEDHGMWRRLLGGLPNVEVRHQGNVVPWLLACRALLHNGCTTAVEAALLDQPALSYMPVTSDDFDYPLPNALSHRATTPEDVVHQLAAILGGGQGPVDARHRDAVLARHVAATDGPLAVDRVVDALAGAGYLEHPPARPPLAQVASGWLGCTIRTVSKRFNSQRRHHRNSAAYHAHRFPELSTGELEQRIGRYQRLLGRFHGVRVERRSRHVFHLSSPVRSRAGATAHANGSRAEPAAQSA